MPARDAYHDVVRSALERDGWSVTDDPLALSYGDFQFFIDLGLAALVGATLNGRRIAVEVKSFRAPSIIADLERALGQFVLYRSILQATFDDRELYLAVSDGTWERLFDTALGELLIDKLALKLLVFEPKNASILRWVPFQT